jgi:hypothetical protein
MSLEVVTLHVEAGSRSEGHGRRSNARLAVAFNCLLIT